MSKSISKWLRGINRWEGSTMMQLPACSVRHSRPATAAPANRMRMAEDKIGDLQFRGGEQKLDSDEIGSIAEVTNVGLW